MVMKKLFFVLVFVFVVGFIMANETVSIFGDSIKFEIPDGVFDRRIALKVSDFKRISDYSKYWGDKIELRINILTENVFRTDYKPSDISTAIQELLAGDKIFNSENLLALLDKKNSFVFSVYSSDAFLPQSYAQILYKDRAIGETFFISNFHDFIAPVNYAFAFYFVANNSIIQIAISLNDYNEYNVPRTLPDYFIERNGVFYWKNRESVNFLYQQITSDTYKSLPPKLQVLREARDLFLTSLEVSEWEF
jgi:hypothetical protein